jgi:hypothetical protein
MLNSLGKADRWRDGHGLDANSVASLRGCPPPRRRSGQLADYYPLIAQAVDRLKQSDAETRRTIYDRARAAMVAPLRDPAPPLSESDINLEQLALERAIRKVEAESQGRSRRSPSIRPNPPPGPIATAKRLTLAGKIYAILKLSVVASVLLGSSSVGYYYLVHLPHRVAQFEPERVLERLRAAAEKRAEQDQLLFEQQASEQRAAEQQVVEERQALEKANRHQACLSRATDNYNASRLAACDRPREKIIKDQDNCVKLGFSRKVCAMAHVVREASPNCTLPRTVTFALDADVEKARNRCLEEDRVGLQ